MEMICGGAAAESFPAFASGFPVAEDVPEAVPAGAASVKGSNVANGSWRALESGFPRRSRGRFGSSIGSSEADAFGASGGAGVFAVSGAGGALASGGVGALAGGAAVVGAGAAAGFGWSLSLSLSLSLLSELLSESGFCRR